MPCCVLSQLRSLLRRMEVQQAMDVGRDIMRTSVLSSCVDSAGAAIVLVGDFNFDRSSELHTFLARGTTPSFCKGKKAISHTLLPLQDAYLESPPPWGAALRSSFRNGRLLDYVWTSAPVTVRARCRLASASPRPHPSGHMPSDIRSGAPSFRCCAQCRWTTSRAQDSLGKCHRPRIPPTIYPSARSSRGTGLQRTQLQAAAGPHGSSSLSKMCRGSEPIASRSTCGCSSSFQLAACSFLLPPSWGQRRRQ